MVSNVLTVLLVTTEHGISRSGARLVGRNGVSVIVQKIHDVVVKSSHSPCTESFDVEINENGVSLVFGQSRHVPECYGQLLIVLD